MHFAELFMSSGLVINPEVTWITFHGTYDFSYLIKTLLNQKLSKTIQEFIQILFHMFPNNYDIKNIINEFTELRNLSLTKLANELGVDRAGTQHQAGSDAQLTAKLFFKIVKQFFNKKIPNRFKNQIYGINSDTSSSTYSNSDILNKSTINFFN